MMTCMEATTSSMIILSPHQSVPGARGEQDEGNTICFLSRCFEPTEPGERFLGPRLLNPGHLACPPKLVAVHTFWQSSAILWWAALRVHKY